MLVLHKRWIKYGFICLTRTTFGPVNKNYDLESMISDVDAYSIKISLCVLISPAVSIHVLVCDVNVTVTEFMDDKDLDDKMG